MKIGIGVKAVATTDRRHRGTIDNINIHPDGQVVYRINDHWFFAKDLVAA